MKIYQYFLIGLKSTWNDNFFKTVAFIVGTIVLVTMVRKLIIVSRSGGKFSEPMHISNGNLYIHSGFVPGSREIPLKDLAEVEIYFVRGVHLRKKGRSKSIFVGKSKGNDERLAQLKKQLKKHKVKVREIK